MRTQEIARIRLSGFSLPGVLLGAALLAAGSPAVAAAADLAMSPSADSTTVTAKVVTSTATELVVETETGGRLTLAVDSTTSEPPALAAGDRVTVRYASSAGALHADSVVILPTAPSNATSTMPNLPPPASASSTSTNAGANQHDPASSVTAPSTLPKTASDVPLVLALGAAAGMLGVGLHLVRSRA